MYLNISPLVKASTTTAPTTVQVPLLRTITGVAFDVGVPGNVLGYERVDVTQSFGTYEIELF